MIEFTLEFYEDELDLLETPNELKAYLEEIHKEFDLSDLSDLLRYFEEIEQYEKCSVVVQFANENNIKV